MAKMYINVEMGSTINIVYFTTKKSALANAKRWTDGAYQEKYKITEIETWELADDCGVGFRRYEIDEFEKWGKIIAITRHQE